MPPAPPPRLGRAGAGRPDRGLHGHVRARPGAVPRAGRVAARADRRALALRRQRRRLEPRALADDPRGGRRRSALRALALGASGSASIATSSARCGSRPPRRELIALCDQDDRWHPDKLATLRAALGDAVLVYSDQRLVDADGRVLRDTLWRGPPQQPHRPRLDAGGQHASPAPRRCSGARSPSSRCRSPTRRACRSTTTGSRLVALAAGDVAYVDRPLYDYVQHRGRVLRRRDPRRAPRRRRRRAGGRGAYFRGYLPRAVLARGAARSAAPARLTPAQAARAASASSPPSARRRVRVAGAAAAAGAARPHRDARQRGRAAARVAGAGRRRSRARRPGGGRSTRACPTSLSFQQRRLRRWRARV